jgi:hypothetical protein
MEQKMCRCCTTTLTPFAKADFSVLQTIRNLTKRYEYYCDIYNLSFMKLKKNTWNKYFKANKLVDDKEVQILSVHKWIQAIRFKLQKYSLAYCPRHYYYYYYYYYIVFLLSQVFFSLVLSSWASGEPHHSGFKSQIVALSLWCVMFLARRLFLENILLLLLLLSSLVTGFFSSLVLLLSQWWAPPLRLQVSACTTFLMMCDVPMSSIIVIIIICLRHIYIYINSQCGPG